MANRLTTPLLTPNQARADALGILLSALLILIGLLWQQVQPKPPETVTPLGVEVFEFKPNLPESLKTELAWASHSLLTNTVTRAIAVWVDGEVLLWRGILPPTREFQAGTIVDRALKTQKPIYLVKLALYPGKIEFNYFPENIQGIIVQPLGSRGVMILGANAPRSYTKQDEQWVAAIAAKLLFEIEAVAPTASPLVEPNTSLPV